MTCKDDKMMTAAAVNWLTQASFAPPLVVLGAKADAPSTAMVESSGLFCISVMETGQVPISSAFFKHVEPEGNKFGDIEFTLSPHGRPVLKDALAYFGASCARPSSWATTGSSSARSSKPACSAKASRLPWLRQASIMAVRHQATGDTQQAAFRIVLPVTCCRG